MNRRTQAALSILVAWILCVPRLAVLADEPTLRHGMSVTPSERDANFLSILLDRKPDDTDYIVLTYVNPQGKATHNDVFTVPSGNLDAAIKSALEIGTKTGIITHQVCEFTNGTFDFVCRTNTFDKRGVYAATNVYTKVSKVCVGSCTTYFDLSRWSADDANRIEIPLPEPGPRIEEEYLPKSCVLRVSLVDKTGKTKSSIHTDVKRK